MEAKAPSTHLILLLLLSTILTSSAASSTALSPTPPPTPPTTASSTLDPKQLAALHSIGLPTTPSPCATATACDSATPFHHLLSLTLANCPRSLTISPTALHALSTLRSLTFLHCPILPPHHLPPTLTSFSASSSFRHLTGVYLSRLHNLTSLSIVHVPLNTSGPSIILSGMPHLRTFTISNSNLSGVLPHHWHTVKLTTIDLSSNRLTGTIHPSFGLMSSLTTLNLSSNSLTGIIPADISNATSLTTIDLSHNSFSGAMPELETVTHLDLSSNKFNGSIPVSLSGMVELRYLNLENNELHGVLPFNASFIKRMEVFKVGGNGKLCYNRTVLSAKMGLGIAPCDKYGLPVSPPPVREAHGESSDYGDDDDGGGKSLKRGGGRRGTGRVVLGVAIALSCFVFLVIFIVCVSRMCR